MAFAVRTDFASSQARCTLNVKEKEAAQAGKPCGYHHGNSALDAEYDYVKGLEVAFHKIDDAPDERADKFKISGNASNQSNPNLGQNLNLMG